MDKLKYLIRESVAKIYCLNKKTTIRKDILDKR